ncbi:MAG TPA: NUDIX hydrolase [Candidatus Omnitrophota bacterium]|nr:NUDIX hydrolase [Candidatus Omnitrophota bacterium]
MSQKKYRTLKKKVIFSKGPIRLVDCDIHTPHGKVLSRQILEHPGCVVIIPRTKSGKYLLVKQYRFPLGRHLWEFPAGGREPRETFPAAAKRELMEEVGRKPGRLKKLLEFYPTPGVSGEKMHVFLADRMVPAHAPKDEDEDFELGEFSLAELGRMIRRKQIVDGKTIIGFFYLKTLQNQ